MQQTRWPTENVGILPLPAGISTSANQATEISYLSSIDGKLNSLGQKTMAASAPVVLPSDQILTVNQITSTTPAVTRVAGSASNVILLALNTSRKMATFYNESTKILYLKMGATASNISYTVQLVSGAYYELPSPVYTGRIDGIWSGTNGAVQVTELT